MASKQLNTLFLADGYKISHHLQYPPGTTTIFSYFESRGGKWDKTVFFGLQYILKKYLCGVVVTKDMIDEAELFMRNILDHAFTISLVGSISYQNTGGNYQSGSELCQKEL